MELWAIAREFGLPLAFLAFALYTGSRRIWVWGREVTEAEERAAAAEATWQKRYDAAVAEWRERLRGEVDDYERRLKREQELSANWERLTLESHGITRQAQGIAATAAHALDKAGR